MRSDEQAALIAKLVEQLGKSSRASSKPRSTKLASLKSWLEHKQPKVASDTLTRRAINYTLNQWSHLERYCEHGQLRISNVLTENAIWTSPGLIDTSTGATMLPEVTHEEEAESARST